MSLKKSTRDLTSRGWHLLPVAEKGKVPLTAHGLRDATNDLNIIDAWLKAWPNMNVGIRTGAESGIVVLDVDPKPSLNEALSKLKQAGYKLPKTLVVTTGSGGRHYYFKHPGLKIKTMVGILPGIDVRGDGGYVVAPPSTHETGGKYVVLHDRPLAKCPGWLIAATSSNLPSVTSAGGIIAQDGSGHVVSQGGRDQYLTAMAGALRRRGASEEAILAAVEAENKARCQPPLSRSQCWKIAKSVSRYAPDDVRGATEVSQDAFVKASGLVKDMQDFLKNDDKKLGTPTGIAFLDRMLGGGKRAGEITGWSAIAKAGKSSWLHYMIHHMTHGGVPHKIGYASREMSPAEEVLPNILSLSAGKNVWLEGVSEEDLKYDWSRLFFAPGYGHFSIDAFRSWAMSLREHEGVTHLMLDHLLYAMMDPENYQEVSRFCRDIKAFVKEHGFHLDLIIQPYKLQPGERIGMNSLRGGASIAQAIDNLFTLERVPGHNNVTRLALELGRSKLCETGAEVFLEYDRKTTRFKEVEPVFDDEAKRFEEDEDE